MLTPPRPMDYKFEEKVSYLKVYCSLTKQVNVKSVGQLSIYQERSIDSCINVMNDSNSKCGIDMGSRVYQASYNSVHDKNFKIISFLQNLKVPLKDRQIASHEAHLNQN